MPVSRMRMRPWLEKLLNSSSISGLVWMDKKDEIFSIPWKHAARHGWEVEKDACVFKEWAVHTGKFTQGQTTADPKTWKANFRCAMNSLPDIEEIKNKSVNKGHQAVRVYRMLKVTAKPKGRRSKGKEGKRRSKSSKIKEEEMECSEVEFPKDDRMQLRADVPSPQENTVDSTEHQEPSYGNTYDVPDWSASIEIGPDSTSLTQDSRFQLSPEHSPEYDPTGDIIEMAYQYVLDKGFQSNETCTGSYSHSSPGSRWSDTSSADELDLPLYTDLGSGPPGVPASLDDLWNNSSTDSWNTYDDNSFLRERDYSTTTTLLSW